MCLRAQWGRPVWNAPVLGPSDPSVRLINMTWYFRNKYDSQLWKLCNRVTISANWKSSQFIPTKFHTSYKCSQTKDLPKILLGCCDQNFSSLGRRTFTITDEMGNSCTYTQSLRFGSSYTLLVPPSITFGDQVMRAVAKCQMRSMMVATRLNARLCCLPL